MLFKKKNQKCKNCNSKIDNKFSYCPYCGENFIDEEKYMKDYGLLGKGKEISSPQEELPTLGITDRLIGSLMNSLIKNLDKQFRQLDKEFERAEVQNFPNGVSIKIGSSPAIKRKRQSSVIQGPVSEKQFEKMNSLPRVKAETKVKRINDKIVYELETPGIESPNDVFVSKLESGYEIKAIGDKKVYVNTLPINLPLKAMSLNKEKLFIEFVSF